MNTSKLPLQLDAHWLVHEPARLAMMTFLVEQPRSFWEIKRELGLGDSTIHNHAARLEAVGYMAHRSVPSLGRTRTIFHLTRDGLAALSDYAITVSGVSAFLATAITCTSR